MKSGNSIVVEGKQFGLGKALFPTWEMALPPVESSGIVSVSLRDLIARTVREEVAAFRARQEQRQFLHALSADQIQAGVAKGKVDVGGRGADGFGLQEVSEEQAIAGALQAFSDGLYFVFVDDAQKEQLDEMLTLRPGSRLTFLRLVALAGG